MMDGSKSRISRTVSHLKSAAWLLLALLFLYPMLWMVLGSFKSSNVEIFGRPFSLPHQISFANFQKAVRQGNMGSYFINSLWVTGLTAAAVVSFGAWAGFALSKRRVPLRHFWLAVELEEAAKLDGVGTARFYLHILLPVSKPAAATIVVITCLNAWNEFLMSMLFIIDPGMKTLPVGMIAFEQAHNTDYPALLAGLSLISVPTLLIYAIFNRQVIRGVIAGAVK